MTNQKDSHNDRIIAVIPVATSSNLQPEFVSLSSMRALTSSSLLISHIRFDL